jgi:hypothetical protein
MDKAVAHEAMHHVFTVVVDFGLRVIYRSSHVWMFGAQFSEGPDLLSCTSMACLFLKVIFKKIKMFLFFYIKLIFF